MGRNTEEFDDSQCPPAARFATRWINLSAIIRLKCDGPITFTPVATVDASFETGNASKSNRISDGLPPQVNSMLVRHVQACGAD